MGKTGPGKRLSAEKAARLSWRDDREAVPRELGWHSRPPAPYQEQESECPQVGKLGFLAFNAWSGPSGYRQTQNQASSRGGFLGDS